jgi:ribosomal-protein-alanine N-acetyltransferase
MVEQDIASVYQIEQDTASDPWDEKIFLSCAKIYDAFVAILADNTVIGFGIIVVYDNIQEAHIINLAVDINWQNQGIGSLLLQHLMNNKVNKIFLEVNVNNLAAISLYEKFHFKRVGIRKNYYNTKDGKEDALVLLHVPALQAK